MTNWQRRALLLCMGALLLMTGCAGYGSLRRVTPGEQAVNIGELTDRVDRYRVYRAGVGPDNPSGVLFIPRDGAYAVELGPLWREVASAEDLQRVLAGLANPVDWRGYDVELYSVVDATGGQIGFLYTGWSHAVVKQRDATTVWISDLPDPPQYLGAGEHRGGLW